MPIMSQEEKDTAKAKSKAFAKSTALAAGQSALIASGAMAQYNKYNGMYNQAQSLINTVQKAKKVIRKIVLKGSIFDTMNPSGTAANLALQVSTAAEKGTLYSVTKEYGTKTLTVVNRVRSYQLPTFPTIG
jgi:hypothetical protein